VEKDGAIKVFDNSASVKTSTTYLDIKRKVTSGGERGLLGLAFHPDFKSNGYFFVNYTAGSPLKTVIARYKAASATSAQADAQSETICLHSANLTITTMAAACNLAKMASSTLPPVTEVAAVIRKTMLKTEKVILAKY
jgi:hypothetical protein